MQKAQQLQMRVGSLKAAGSEYQTPGPTTTKSCSPNVTIRVFGTTAPTFLPIIGAADEWKIVGYSPLQGNINTNHL